MERRYTVVCRPVEWCWEAESLYKQNADQVALAGARWQRSVAAAASEENVMPKHLKTGPRMGLGTGEEQAWTSMPSFRC